MTIWEQTGGITIATIEIIELILKIAASVINVATVAIITIMVSKWHRRIEDKLDSIQRYIHHVTNRNDIVYINQLEGFKRELIQAERYEDAEKVNNCIIQEYNRIGEKIKDDGETKDERTVD